ncbi:MAG: hypothetical protein IH582_13875 [Afipia sp.]|nr:hypothetical protein [Afipia sp.]
MRKLAGSTHDLCVLDAVISITLFMNRDEPWHWWAYTEERKNRCEAE